MNLDTLKQDDYSTVGGDGGCSVAEVRAGTTSPMPNYKGNFNRLSVTARDPHTPFVSEFSEI